jgi:peptidoglycan/xylan/chitin deacetylase (PgdA/CDA1 family)
VSERSAPGWSALLGSIALSPALFEVLACTGPKLEPMLPPEGPRTGGQELQLPAGAECGPERVEALPAVAPLPEGAASEPSESCEDAPAAESGRHFELRPLGVGYPNVVGPVNAMPPGVAYLTFDDGPSEWTHTFLDILRDKAVPATFFVTAKQLKGEEGLDGVYTEEDGDVIVYRDVLARIVAEGHQLANHTVNHVDLAHVTRGQLTSEIEENELLVNRALLRAGAKPEVLTLFRPPYGSPWFTGIAGMPGPQASERIASHALNIMWNVTSGDAQDWALGESYSRTSAPVIAPGAPALDVKRERVLNDVVNARPTRTGDGMIVLMHDTHSATRDVLPQMIDGLRARGYTFETVEHYVQWRWGRPSLDMTPGPGLYQSCVPERDWGCEALGGAPLGSDRASEVCGRFWVAYHALGGAAALGAPLGAPERSAETGVYAQPFERATIELHPENPPPCHIVAIPR